MRAMSTDRNTTGVIARMAGSYSENVRPARRPQRRKDRNGHGIGVFARASSAAPRCCFSRCHARAMESPPTT